MSNDSKDTTIIGSACINKPEIIKRIATTQDERSRAPIISIGIVSGLCSNY